MYGLRKVNKDLKHYDFTWDLSIGSVNTAPDWNPVAECGGGLHVICGDSCAYGLTIGHYWVVVEFDEAKVIDVGAVSKVETCTVVHVSENSDGLLEYFEDLEFDSLRAYMWAKWIGDVELMRPLVSTPQLILDWKVFVDKLPFSDIMNDV